MADGYGCNEEFEEEDVWAAVQGGSPQSRRAKDASSYAATSGSFSRCPPTGSRTIPRSNAGAEPGGRSLTGQTAPVSIPSWSRVEKNKGPRQGRSYGGYSAGEEGYDHGGHQEEEEEDDDEDRAPPHEYLAKKMARSQISSFSVCEGVGRTLKGRDLRKVRNAVLTKTGFLE